MCDFKVSKCKCKLNSTWFRLILDNFPQALFYVRAVLSGLIHLEINIAATNQTNQNMEAGLISPSSFWIRHQ